MMQFCKECGMELADAATFCPECGCKIECEESNLILGDNQSITTKKSVANGNVNTNQEKENNNNSIVVFVMLITVIFGIVIGLYFYTNQDKTDDKNVANRSSKSTTEMALKATTESDAMIQEQSTTEMILEEKKTEEDVTTEKTTTETATTEDVSE